MESIKSDSSKIVSRSGKEYSLVFGVSMDGKKSFDMCFVMDDQCDSSNFVCWSYGSTDIKSGDAYFINSILDEIEKYEMQIKGGEL